MNQFGQRHVARKRFGQHFLTDQRVLERIRSGFAPKSSQNLIEIGPGKGALTHLLLDHAPQLTVIELDRDLAAALQVRYPPDRLVVHQMDVLDCNLKRIHKRFDNKKLRLVGNLPYNITTPLIFHLIDQLDHVEDMLFMVQKEVAMRLTATPGSKQYGRLSVMAALSLSIEHLFDVPPEAFEPPPKVNSSVIRLQPLPDRLSANDIRKIQRIVAAAFGQRRKTLRNSLSGVVETSSLETIGIDPSLRAEALSPEQFVQIAQTIALHA